MRGDQTDGSTWVSIVAVLAVAGAMGAIYIPLAFSVLYLPLMFR